MYYPFFTKSVNYFVPTIVPLLISSQYYLRLQIEKSNTVYDPDIYEPFN